eukprot:4926802-Prymnesium_polylepis.1
MTNAVVVADETGRADGWAVDAGQGHAAPAAVGLLRRLSLHQPPVRCLLGFAVRGFALPPL